MLLENRPASKETGDRPWCAVYAMPLHERWLAIRHVGRFYTRRLQGALDAPETRNFTGDKYVLEHYSDPEGEPTVLATAVVEASKFKCYGVDRAGSDSSDGYSEISGDEEHQMMTKWACSRQIQVTDGSGVEKAAVGVKVKGVARLPVSTLEAPWSCVELHTVPSNDARDEIYWDEKKVVEIKKMRYSITHWCSSPVSQERVRLRGSLNRIDKHSTTRWEWHSKHFNAKAPSWDKCLMNTTESEEPAVGIMLGFVCTQLMNGDEISAECNPPYPAAEITPRSSPPHPPGSPLLKSQLDAPGDQVPPPSSPMPSARQHSPPKQRGTDWRNSFENKQYNPPKEYHDDAVEVAKYCAASPEDLMALMSYEELAIFAGDDVSAMHVTLAHVQEDMLRAPKTPRAQQGGVKDLKGGLARKGGITVSYTHLTLPTKRIV
eukprot:TRINITY_DN4031_c0_g1_i1.p1 TRINITY_DN4031_c0_g1~~TRINITY_DN4031_c0_g1_i1.p1  ORF type:complete len:433 (-),score=83.99 TRINITY_DN4031_c0_g1_i1:130-1428(-)